MKRTIAILAFLLSTIVLLAQKNNTSSRKEIRAERNARIEMQVDSLIQSKNFSVIAQSAQPVGWQQIQLTSLYEIQVADDSVEVNLPYFGRAYTVDYTSTEGGIRINSALENYQQEQKRKCTEITFETRTKADRYQFRISVSPSGYASIYVNSNNRQAINFNGILDGIN